MAYNHEIEYKSDELANIYIQDHREPVTIQLSYVAGQNQFKLENILNDSGESVMDLYNLHGDFQQEVDDRIQTEEGKHVFETQRERYDD